MSSSTASPSLDDDDPPSSVRSAPDDISRVDSHSSGENDVAHSDDTYDKARGLKRARCGEVRDSKKQDIVGEEDEKTQPRVDQPLKPSPMPSLDLSSTSSAQQQQQQQVPVSRPPFLPSTRVSLSATFSGSPRDVPLVYNLPGVSDQKQKEMEESALIYRQYRHVGDCVMGNMRSHTEMVRLTAGIARDICLGFTSHASEMMMKYTIRVFREVLGAEFYSAQEAKQMRSGFPYFCTSQGGFPLPHLWQNFLELGAPSGTIYVDFAHMCRSLSISLRQPMNTLSMLFDVYYMVCKNFAHLFREKMDFDWHYRVKEKLHIVSYRLNRASCVISGWEMQSYSEIFRRLSQMYEYASEVFAGVYTTTKIAKGCVPITPQDFYIMLSMATGVLPSWLNHEVRLLRSDLSYESPRFFIRFKQFFELLLPPNQTGEFAYMHRDFGLGENCGESTCKCLVPLTDFCDSIRSYADRLYCRRARMISTLDLPFLILGRLGGYYCFYGEGAILNVDSFKEKLSLSSLNFRNERSSFFGIANLGSECVAPFSLTAFKQKIAPLMTTEGFVSSGENPYVGEGLSESDEYD